MACLHSLLSTLASLLANGRGKSPRIANVSLVVGIRNIQQALMAEVCYEGDRCIKLKCLDPALHLIPIAR